MIKVATLLGWILLAGLLFTIPSMAEPICSGATYPEPTCGGDCALSNCHDISFNQEGTVFQCCFSAAAVPELPSWLNPFTLALLLSVLMLKVRRLRGIFLPAGSAPHREE